MSVGGMGSMARFETTRWSIVLRAGQDGSHARNALESLCRIYRPPVLEFIRCRGYPPEIAEDLAQSFFAHFLEHAGHENADPARGRFRTYLLTSLKRFLNDAGDAARAAKRGGRIRLTSLDAHPPGASFDHLADADTPERAFERSWAYTLLDSAMQRLREEAVQAGKLELFEALQEFLTERPDEADYMRAAARLNLRRNTLAVAVHRMRHRLRQLIREELAQTIGDAAELESEIRAMRPSLDRAAR